MGHFCWICLKILPNEKFSGKGHKNHICKKCSKIPKEKIEKISDERFIFDMLHQKNISLKNIKKLERMGNKYEGILSKRAKVMAKVAKVHPHRKKRIGHLYNRHHELFDELVGLEIIEDFITPRIQDEIEYEKWLESGRLDFERTEKNEEETQQIANFFFEDDDELPF